MIKTTPNPKRTSYRLAVIVSRKVNKSAVARNRIRRRLYASVRNLQKDIVVPHDIVLNVYDQKIIDEPPKELDKLVKKQLASAGVLAKTAALPKDGQPPRVL